MKKNSRNLKPKTYNLTSGSLLIESLVAISVLILGLLSVMGFMSRSLSLNRVVSDQYVASYLAAEGVELVKNIIDTNYLQGRAFNDAVSYGDHSIDFNDGSLGNRWDNYLLYNPNDGTYEYDGNGIPTQFKRKIVITDTGNLDELQVNSIITWTTRGGGSFKIDAEDHFFRWH